MSETTVYRFFNNDTGIHFYTADEKEKNYIQKNLTSFIFEGASYQSVDPSKEGAEAVPVYRFRNLETGIHLYTISEAERKAIVKSNQFVDEGEAFFAYKTKIEDSIPVYRFLNTDTGAHFYTTSFNEKEDIENNLPEFKAEGIAYYVLPAEPDLKAILPQDDFAIELVYGEGTEAFTPEMIAAIGGAAETWENAISHSSFSEPHTLTIDIEGADLGKGEDAFVAQANFYPEKLEIDANNNVLPTGGYSKVNNNTELISVFSSDAEYLTNVMTHEFAHVMGFGSLWEFNGLIDPITGLYDADTNAGRIYNNDNGTTDVGIPLTTDVGSGSDLNHWQEETFDNELMTHQSESPGISSPLSELTLASLEDVGWNVNYGIAEPYPDSDTELAKI